MLTAQDIRKQLRGSGLSKVQVEKAIKVFENDRDPASILMFKGGTENGMHFLDLYRMIGTRE